jgi:hypothetical protein
LYSPKLAAAVLLSGAQQVGPAAVVQGLQEPEAIGLSYELRLRPIAYAALAAVQGAEEASNWAAWFAAGVADPAG